MTNLLRLASATLDGTNSYYEVISFENRDGKELQIAVRASYAAKDSKLADCLRDAGIADEDSPSIVLRAKELLSTAARYSGTIVIDGGWHGKPGKRFVFGDEIIAPPRRRAQSGKPRTRPPRKLFVCPSFRLKEPMNFIGRNSVPGGADGFFKRKGTIESWKTQVAQPAGLSSRAVLAIAAAFAAPCLAYLGVAPFGIVFTGPSSTGKTMCTLAAASVVGLGDEMSLSTWHMTPSRYEELARRHGDLLLPIDDLSTIEGDDRARFKKAANFAHWLSHGGRRERLSSAGTEATSRPITGQGLRAIVVTSSETSLAELAHRGGRQKLDEGVKVRLIGVPAVAAGAAGVFDRLEGSSHDRHRAGELTDRIKLAARRHQGEVFVGWLRHLAATPSRKVEEKLRALLKSFVHRCRKISTEGTALRIAEKFGVIYAAGCMAIAAGFLPWSRKAFRQAVLACYRAAVVGPSEPAVAEQALNTLREHLADGTRIASRRPTEAKLKDGWREKRPDGTTVTYVVGKAFDRWFIEPERGQLLNTLIRQGVLKSGLGRARTLQRAPRGGDRVRVYPMAF